MSDRLGGVKSPLPPLQLGLRFRALLLFALLPPPHRLPDPASILPSNRLTDPLSDLAQLLEPRAAVRPAAVPREEAPRLRVRQERRRDPGLVQRVDDVFSRDVAGRAGRVGAAAERGDGRVDRWYAQLSGIKAVRSQNSGVDRGEVDETHRYAMQDVCDRRAVRVVAVSLAAGSLESATFSSAQVPAPERTASLSIVMSSF